MQFSKEKKTRVSIQLYLNHTERSKQRTKPNSNILPITFKVNQKQNCLVSPRSIQKKCILQNKNHVQSLNISKQKIQIQNTHQNESNIQFSKNSKNKLQIKHKRTQSNRLNFCEMACKNKNDEMSNFSNSLQNISKEVIQIPFAKKIILPKKVQNPLIIYEKNTRPLEFKRNLSHTRKNSLQKNLLSPSVKIYKFQPDNNRNSFKGPLSVIPRPKKIQILTKQLPKLSDFVLKPIKITESGSILYLALHKKLKMMFAIKSIRKGLLKNRLNQFLLQLKLGYSLQNPNIVQTYGFFTDQNNFYLIRQYMEEEFTAHNHLRINQAEISITVSQVLIGFMELLNQVPTISFLIKDKNLARSHGVFKITSFKVFYRQKLKDTQYLKTFKHLIYSLLQKQTFDEKTKQKGAETTASILFSSHKKSSKDFHQFTSVIQNLYSLSKQNMDRIWNHSFLAKHRMNSIIKD